MKKLFAFSLIGLVLTLTGCTFNKSTANQVLNNQTQPINAKNYNLPSAEQNQNVNQPAATINQNLNKNVSITQPTDPTANWQIYQGDYGFQIQYPSGWKIMNEINAKNFNRPTAVLLNVSFGNGTYGNGYDGELFVSVYDKKIADIETPIKDVGKQFSDRQEKRENIKINGVSAVKVTITTPTISSWVYQVVIIEQGNYSYLINNGAIKSDLFNKFYNSFQIN